MCSHHFIMSKLIYKAKTICLDGSIYFYIYYIGQAAYLYEEANPDWALSLDLGYSTVPPDESRHARYMQRSIRRQELLSDQDGEREISHSEDNIDEENSTVEFDDASCQTDLELPELSVLQQKEFVVLKKEMLT